MFTTYATAIYQLMVGTVFDFSVIGVNISVNMMEILIGSTCCLMLFKFLNFCMGDRVEK